MTPLRRGTAMVLRLLMLAAALLAASPAAAQTEAAVAATCRRVADAPFIRIAPEDAANLAGIGLDRAAIFERMHETSVPETMGCWAMPAGNFDSQLVSVGMSQWNFGTGSLQPVLRAWRKGLGRRFRRTRRALAPVYGKLLFSRACLAVPVRGKCRAGILAAEDAEGRLSPALQGELTAIFESDAMLQVQTDAYVALLELVRGDLLRVFP